MDGKNAAYEIKVPMTAVGEGAVFVYTIKNANVLNDRFEFEKADVVIKDGKIAHKTANSEKAGMAEGEIIDACGKYVLPGLVNIHTHGAVGFDCVDCDYNGINEMSKYWASTGTTTFLATTTTASYDDTKKAMSVIAEAIKRGTDGAAVAGINMEGPYLAASHKGAHRADLLRSPKEFCFDDIQKAAEGNIKLVTLAPEVDGAIDFVKKHAKDVRISLGHTGAGYEDCMAAFENGAKHVTHLFNAMPPIHHRNLSLIAAAFENDVTVEIIGDGLHVKPVSVMMAYKLFGDEKLIFINDSMQAAGLGEGEYYFCGTHVVVKDNIACNDENTIVGGIASLWDCVKNAGSWGIPLESAVKMASYNPASAVGLGEKTGSIKEGLDADIVIASDKLDVEDVFVKGRRIHAGKK